MKKFLALMQFSVNGWQRLTVLYNDDDGLLAA